MEDLSNLVRINEDIAKTLGIQIFGIYCVIDKNLDLYINGNVQLDRKPCKGERLTINADIKDKYGRVLRPLSDYTTENLLSLFSSFSIFCGSINRFFDPETIDTISIYPVLHIRG